MFRWIYSRPLWKVILYSIAAIVFWGKLSIKVSDRVWNRHNKMLLLFSVFAVIYATLLRTPEVSELVLMPFYSFIAAQQQPEMYRSMLLNVFLFLPMGISLPFVLDKKVRHNIICTIIMAMVFSTAIEITQYVFCLGRCETDDVIMNTLGAAAGSISFRIAKREARKKSDLA